MQKWKKMDRKLHDSPKSQSVSVCQSVVDARPECSEMNEKW